MSDIEEVFGYGCSLFLIIGLVLLFLLALNKLVPTVVISPEQHILNAKATISAAEYFIRLTPTPTPLIER